MEGTGPPTAAPESRLLVPPPLNSWEGGGRWEVSTEVSDKRRGRQMTAEQSQISSHGHLPGSLWGGGPPGPQAGHRPLGRLDLEMKEKRKHHCREMDAGRTERGRGSRRDCWDLPELNCKPAAAPLRPKYTAPSPPCVFRPRRLRPALPSTSGSSLSPPTGASSPHQALFLPPTPPPLPSPGSVRRAQAPPHLVMRRGSMKLGESRRRLRMGE